MNQTIKLDTRKREGNYGEARVAPLRRGERNNALLTVKICANGVPYDLAGKTASLVATAADGKLVGPYPMECAEAGIARVMLPAALYSAVGAFTGYVEIREGETLVDTTDSFGGKVIECADLDSEQAAEFTPLLGEVREATDAAIKAAASVGTINVIAPKTVATAATVANNANSVAIGNGARCTSDKDAQLAIGFNATAKGTNATSIGFAPEADGHASMSIGMYARGSGDYSIAIGTASAANGKRSKAFGDYAQSIGNYTDALSSNTFCVGNNSQAIGYRSATCAIQSAAIGASATVNGASVPDPNVKDFKANVMNSVALGSFSVADEQNTISVGNDVTSITKHRRKFDGTGKLTETAPFWETVTENLPASARHLKRRITNVADPIGGHDAATKNYVDTKTSNVLKGTVKEPFVHVEDAFAGAALRKMTVEGACKQDGIPSPDAPKPITVIEHPTVKVVGKNLWAFASSATSIEGHQNEFVKEGTPFTLLPGEYTFSAVGSLGNTDAPLFGYTATGKRFQFFRIMRNVTNPKYSFTVTEPIASIYFVSNAADSNTGTISSIQLERNSTATEYKPHTSQSLTFALPAEHPYLAKLPDGTADEIVVDKEGNVELVARVAKVLPSELVRYAADDAAGGASYAGIVFANTSQTKGRVLCSAYQPTTGSAQSGTIYCPNKTTIIVRDSRFTSKEKAIELLAGVVVYVAVEETRYQLGKIDMPKAQDSIVNVWTDAEVTPNTGIRYVRDVNIVVANLESAIASITEG